MREKHTEATWELDVEGIAHEIEANGSLNGIDVNNKWLVNQLAAKVFQNRYYINRIVNLASSEKDDKISRYYDVLWEVVDVYK